MKTASRFPLFLALLSLTGLAISGVGVRQGWWPYRVGFQLLEWSAYCGMAAAGIALLALAIPKMRKDAWRALLSGFAIGLAVAYLPWSWRQQAQALPKIHDISTDLVNPPQFFKVLPLRATAPNIVTYGGPEVAAAQKLAYADIQPQDLSLGPTDAFKLALGKAREMGWEIVDADAATGRIEATATTLWFGFKDDVVIRITPLDGGSRLDMRSVSRVGRSDVGANAARIRAYIAALKK